MISLNLRAAVPEDAPLLLAWRNDPLSVENSLSGSAISLAEHQQWFAQLNQRRSTIWIAETHDCERVGMVRADHRRDPPVIRLSWIIAPGHRRRGIGKQMVQMVVAIYTFGGWRIEAQIKVGNTASIKIAEHVRLGRVNEHDEIIEFCKEP